MKSFSDTGIVAIFSALALGQAASAHDIAHDHATTTYLGNEGIMVARGDTKILFDAFYNNSYGQYALVPDNISEAMMNNTPPYDGVDAVFISHVHGDHFTAEPAIAYLRARPDVEIYGSKQVREAILEAGVDENDPLMERVISYDLQPEHDPISFDMDGLDVDVVAIPHSGNMPDIQNFAWRVTLDDKTTVMHLGDAGPVDADFERHKEHFDKRHTHGAYAPYWFLTEEAGRSILETYIKADSVTGIHVPASAAGNGDAIREQVGGDVFTDPGETRKIGGKKAD